MLTIPNRIGVKSLTGASFLGFLPTLQKRVAPPVFAPTLRPEDSDPRPDMDTARQALGPHPRTSAGVGKPSGIGQVNFRSIHVR
jgi:hypothetical protein